MGDIELSNIRAERRDILFIKHATLACSYFGCDCGGTVEIEVTKGWAEPDLPDWQRQLRLRTIVRECPKRLAHRRALKVASTRRWRERHPDEARTSTRDAVRRYRERAKTAE